AGGAVASRVTEGGQIEVTVAADAPDPMTAAPAATAAPSAPSLAAEPHLGPDLALWVENLTVSFDGFKALDDVTLLLDRGELRCIIGPNGAGKTTLMDVITGKTRPDSGAVYLESKD